ncbi:MAG: N-acetylglucosamine-6-phosphate deacetylase [Clostridia bacterium]|nr:N-acetylglucosamine-6-phosphate deacetylase [Clostridia bacterium]
MLIRNAVVFTGQTFAPGLRVRIVDGRIAETGDALTPAPGEETLDLGGDFLLPGLVDVHIHGIAGHDAMRGKDDVLAMGRTLRTYGVAAFCPTTMSASDADTAAALAGIRAAQRETGPDGARILGAHMEAPYLSDRHPGAQDGRFFRDPDPAHLLALTGGRPETVRVITLAPERAGSEAFIREAVRLGIRVSVGHTDADAETLHRAGDAGATRLTHTFNAHPPLHHRAPGSVGAALADERFYCELIPDGVHLHRDTVRLIALCKREKAVAITDAMEAAGMPDGVYSLGGQRVTVEGGAARLAGGSLAGSVLTLERALENLIRRFGIDPALACAMVTSSPADSVGEEAFGRIRPGTPVPLTRWTQDWRFAGCIG